MILKIENCRKDLPKGEKLKIACGARGVPGEVKHVSNQRKRNRIDTVSSGERKR